jgi:hypothetical protein
MTEMTRERLERVREALRAERWAVARLHALTSESARDIVTRADAEHWDSPAAGLYRARVAEVAQELNAARRFLAQAMDAIDRALLMLADVRVTVPETAGTSAR